MSMATVYNTLHSFTEFGLLREVVVDPNRIWFDTNVEPHHHIYHEDTQKLTDIPQDTTNQLSLPQIPRGHRIERVDLVVRVRAH
jgi:Fur family iron response transcriptional regulator